MDERGTRANRWRGLTIVDEQLGAVSKFKALAAEIAEDGFKYFVLFGMGGSSLCPGGVQRSRLGNR